MAAQQTLFPPTQPELLDTEGLKQIRQAVERSQSAHESTVADWYRQDVPALLAHIEAQARAQRYIPVTEALPTKFNEQGWSDAMQVCTGGRVNIFPHNFIAGKNGKPGYWIRVGEPHHVTDVTHWREFPDTPALVESAATVLVVEDAEAWTPVATALPPSLPQPRIKRSAVVQVRRASGRECDAYYMPAIGGGWRNADTHTPVEGIVVSWRPLQQATSTPTAHE
jgi:hypothetical protein